MPTHLRSARDFGAEETDAYTLDKNHAATKFDKSLAGTINYLNELTPLVIHFVMLVKRILVVWQATRLRTYSLRQNR